MSQRQHPRLLLCGLLAACGGPAPDHTPPNVVLVTLDTTRPDYLSCYDPRRPETPALAGLAAEGVRFETALSSSGVTPVSHATILTGRFQYEHGLRVLSAESGFRLPADQPTIANVLQDAGYSTAAVHSAFPVSAYFGFKRGFDVFDSFDGVLEHKAGDTATSWGEHLQRRSDESVARVQEVLAARLSGPRPFFLWLHLWDPHDALLKPPKEYWSFLEEGQPAASSVEYESMYAAEVRFMDAQLGVLFDALKQRGLWDSTIVAVTADHGEGLSDGFRRHGWGKHRMNYQEQILVPLIVRAPGIGPRVVTDMVRTVDIVPTLLDCAGLPHEGYTGRSLRPLMEGGELEPAIAYADQVNGYDLNARMVDGRPDSAFLYTVCDGVWKLIFRPHMPEESELFQLVQDPGEEHDVLDEQRDVYLRLMRDLALRNPWVLADFPRTGEADDAASDALQGLGYTGGDEDGEDGAVLTSPAHGLEWWWTCPAHPDYRRSEREDRAHGSEHGVDGCAQPVVPCADWQR